LETFMLVRFPLRALTARCVRRCSPIQFVAFTLGVVALAGCGSDPSGPAASAAGIGPVAKGGGTATTLSADLQMSGSASTGSPDAGSAFTYTFRVKNSGPAAANSVLFIDSLPAGMGIEGAGASGYPGACDASGAVVTCDLQTFPTSSEIEILVTVDAPATAGTFVNTGRLTSTTADPSPSSNIVSLTVQVKTGLAPCAVAAGDTTVDGLVAAKFTNAQGLFENFQLQVGAVKYTVLTNFYDGSAPLTHVINLDCQTSPVQFIQSANFVNVSGTIGSEVLPGDTTPTPVIRASVVQTLTHKDGP